MHNSGCPAVQERGVPAVQESGGPAVQDSGGPAVLDSGNPVRQDNGGTEVRRTSIPDWRAEGPAARIGGQGGLRQGPWKLPFMLWMPLCVAERRQGQAAKLTRDITDRSANTGNSEDYEGQLWIIFGSLQSGGPTARTGGPEDQKPGLEDREDSGANTGNSDWVIFGLLQSGGPAARTGGLEDKQPGLEDREDSGEGPGEYPGVCLPLYVAGRRRGQAGEMARDSTDRRANTGKSYDYEGQLWVIFGSS